MKTIWNAFTRWLMTPRIIVNVTSNSTMPKKVSVGDVEFDGRKYVLDIVVDDLKNNGAIRRALD